MSTVFYGSLDFVIDADVFEKENVAQRLLEAFHTPDMQMPEAFKHHEPVASRPGSRTKRL